MCVCGDTAGDLPKYVLSTEGIGLHVPAVHAFAGVLSVCLRRIEGPSERGEKTFLAEYRKPAYGMAVIRKAYHKGLSGSGGVQTYRHDLLWLLCFCESRW
jgi:hypothetical protein